MANDFQTRTERQYYIDWLRILLIISVYLFHVGMIFNKWGWHVKNDVMYGGLLSQVMIFLHNWRMPLLFMISGAGTWYALKNISAGRYLLERSRRLLVPLAAGIFILVPVQVYIEKIDQYSSLLSYYPHMFEGIYPEGNFSWHHLWFIAYLFVIALIISPFLNILRSSRFMAMVGNLEQILTRPFGLNLVIVPLFISQLILRNYFEQETHALVNDWATITYYLIFFLSGFILLPVRSIAGAMTRYRRLYLAETAVMMAVMLLVQGQVNAVRAAEVVYDVAAIVMSWTCAVAVTGYGRKYLDRNSSFRKTANEAIYPFYLLHQPALVITGYFVVKLNIPVLLKVVLIMASSLTLIVSVYWFLVRPFNVTRVLFGMKPQFKSPTNKLKVMKTNEIKNGKYSSSKTACAVMLSLILASVSLSARAQETMPERTLFGPDVSYTSIWAPEVRISSIQGKTGATVGGYTGVMINHTFMLGLAGGVNLTHPTVNYGYFGGIAQAVAYPSRMVHVSAQLVVAYGSTKDYENPKSSLFDNFWNISGERFMMTEPGVNLEVNLSKGIAFVAGASYRFVNGIDPDNEYVENTHLTSQEMSGASFSIGLKISRAGKK
ncbi:MAG: acyltransferase [Bacteroidales bacterium]|jgi:peptidoglycan/LPS O-acetylase OafA/YrhL|nr:acyltransferase [Bacteroidales bacterium]